MRRRCLLPAISGANALLFLGWSAAALAQVPAAGDALVRSGSDPLTYRVNYRPSEADTW
jgi:hypothetical protein